MTRPKRAPKSILKYPLIVLLALGFSAVPVQDHYQKGLQLFRDNQPRQAIEEFALAAGQNESCLKIFSDPTITSLPETGCGKSMNQQPSSDDKIYAAVWFQVARLMWDQETRDAEANKMPSRGHHDRSLLTEYVRRWPRGDYADRASLMLIEDSFCTTWANFPDCGLVEVKGYEELLDQYPGTLLKDEVELKQARAFYEMARLWLSGSGQHSDNMSDLARGQSLEIARELKSSQSLEIQKSAGELEQKLVQEFSRPIAPVPSRVLQKDYN